MNSESAQIVAAGFTERCGTVTNQSTLEGCSQSTNEWAFAMFLLALALLYLSAILLVLLRR